MLSIGLGAGCTPSRDNTDWDARRNRDMTNHWEASVPRDERGMPYLDAKGEIVYQKEFTETRHKYRKHERPIEVSTS